MTQEKVCLNCKMRINGRSDKKFCDDHCRSNYNYIRKGIDNINFVRNINNILRKNRSILKELNVDGNTKVLKKVLTAKGFDFGYYTNIYEAEKKCHYSFCYEMGYLIINEAEVRLIQKEEI